MGEHACQIISYEARPAYRAGDCGREQWYGLYCSKYQRFYCAGKENCATPESYLKHLENARQSQWRG